ncbi:tail fiber protein [Vibrio parahaemolyticus]|nr:tail fiber protein [Vibrio parahaemolyticus]
MTKYFSYVTDIGINKIEVAYNAGETINLIEMAIGDSNGAYVAPDSSFTNLVNEFARVALNDASTDDHLVHVISYIQPTAETAEKTLREYGIYDDEGDMIIYGAYPESLIPSLDSAEYLQLEVENITELENADVVNVTVSPIVPHATETEAGIAKIANEDDVEAGVDDSKILTIYKMLKRVATSVKAGVARFATSAEAINGTDTSTMLNPSTGLALLKSRISSALDGTRTDYSASESALSQVNAKADNAQSTADSATELANAAQDTADSKWTAQDATTSQKGIVQLSDAVTSTSTALAATAKAVKTAYDKALAALDAANAAQDTADSKWTAQDATTSQKGVVQLLTATDSDSESQAATPKSIKQAISSLPGQVAEWTVKERTFGEIYKNNNKYPIDVSIQVRRTHSDNADYGDISFSAGVDVYSTYNAEIAVGTVLNIYARIPPGQTYYLSSSYAYIEERYEIVRWCELT